MAMFYGLAAAVAGILLAFRERSSFASAARSFVAIQMMLIGALLVLVGASERRARAQYTRATSSEANQPPAQNASGSDQAA